MFVIANGNIENGYSLHGPYETPEHAVEDRDHHFPDGSVLSVHEQPKRSYRMRVPEGYTVDRWDELAGQVVSIYTTSDDHRAKLAAGFVDTDEPSTDHTLLDELAGVTPEQA